MKFYSLSRILSTKSDINLIIGQRGNGKTFGVSKYFLEQYKKTKKRFVYMRRWADDIKGYNTENLFNPLSDYVQKLFGEEFTIQYYRHKFYLVNGNGTKVDTIGYCVAISESAHNKSVVYSNIGYILFDEFIQMAGEAVLKDEMLKYENMLSTLIRSNTDVQIFLCANTVSKFSPYFVHYGIQIDKVEQGQIVTKEYPIDDTDDILRISLEYCEYNEDVGKKVNKYTTSNMIRSGKWEIKPTDDIPQHIGEISKDRLLYSIYDPDAEITLGCFLRISKWVELESNPDTLLYETKTHIREFLIIKQIDYKSNYYHLSNQKALNYHTYNNFEYMLKDIQEETDIDFMHELYSGRIFSDNMFTADYFYHCWNIYNRINIRNLL